MRFNKLLIITAITSTTLLSACSINIGADDEDGYISHRSAIKQENNNRMQIASLTPGDELANVMAKMGTADFSEFRQVDGESKHVLYYRTQRLHGDGHTTKDECTPLIFINNKLVAWGHSAL